MHWKDTSSRYGSISIALHWFSLVVLIGVYACINLTDLYPKGSASREALKPDQPHPSVRSLASR